MSRETYAQIKHLDFFKLFAGIVISGHEGCMKPGEAIFQLTLQRFNLSPTKTLFIDDSLPNILKALQLGISNSTHETWLNFDTAKKARYIVNPYLETPEFNSANNDQFKTTI